MEAKEPQDRPDVGQPAGETSKERKVWIAVYVVILLFLAAGAARRIWAMF